MLKQAAAFTADTTDVSFGFTCVIPLYFLKPKAQIVDCTSETRLVHLVMLDTSDPGAKSIAAASVTAASVDAEPLPASRAGRALGC